MVERNIEELKTKVKDLESLKEECVKAEVSIVGYQNNDKLITVLQEEYPKLFSPIKNQIIALVDGKKSLTKVDAKERIKIEDNLMGNCFLAGIRPLDAKNGKLLEFKKLSAKITKEINILKRKIDEDPILRLFEKK